jgi:serine/threonine-protein kinase
VQRRYAEALPEYEAAVRIERELLPPGHAILGATLLRLGDLQRRMRRLEDADRSLSEAIGMLERTRSGQYAQALQFHAGLARAQGRFDLAAERYRASFEAFRAASGDSVYTWLTALAQIESLVDAGRLGEADSVATAAIAALASMPADPYAKLYEANAIGLLRHVQGRIADAITLRRRGLDGLLQMYGADHAEVPQARIALAASLVADGGVEQRREADRLLADASAVLERSEDLDAAAMLGVACLERSRILQAEGDAAAARVELAQALQRLQRRPEDARPLREARALARELGVDHG